MSFSFRVFGLVFLIPIMGFSQGNVDKRAQQVARLLKPASFGKGSEKDLGGIKKQLVRMIEELEKSQRTSHAAPESMISKAFQFRQKDIGRYQAAVSSRAYLNAWKTANSMGLFDDKGRYAGKIASGRGMGKEAVFEYIVPPKHAPEFAKYIGNVRLVTPDQARKEGDTVSVRDAEYLNSLKQVQSEAETRNRMLDREKSKVKMEEKNLNVVGQTDAQERALYEKAVKEAGDLVNQAPNIRVRGKLMSRPGHINQNRYRVDFELVNTVRHPTEVEVDFYMLGFTDKLNLIYVMKHENQKVKFRSGQVRKYEFWSKPVNQYVKPVYLLDQKKSKKISYKGYIAIVKFRDKGIVGIAASDARIMRYATGELPGLTVWPRY